MRIYEWSGELLIPRPREEVFQFFADARNLGEITPEWVKFQILTADPIPMKVGQRIDYRIRIHGIPVRWTTEITRWDPPQSFVDVQVRGPYALWEHTHTFEARPDGTLCGDRVRYRPVGGFLTQWLFVRRDVERIFNHRADRLRAHFSRSSKDP